MIAYSINKNIRETVNFFMAIASVSAIIAIQKWFTLFDIQVAVPSSFALYGLFSFVFDKYLWKISLIRRIHGIPNLNGVWEGAIAKSKDDLFLDYKVKVEILQTWTKIQIEVIGEHTVSKLTSISMDIDHDTRKRIKYIYEVLPEKEGNGQNLRGEGCQNLTLESENKLKGAYFSSKLRKGFMSVERQG